MELRGSSVDRGQPILAWLDLLEFFSEMNDFQLIQKIHARLHAPSWPNKLRKLISYTSRGASFRPPSFAFQSFTDFSLITKGSIITLNMCRRCSCYQRLMSGNWNGSLTVVTMNNFTLLWLYQFHRGFHHLAILCIKVSISQYVVSSPWYAGIALSSSSSWVTVAQ